MMTNEAAAPAAPGPNWRREASIAVATVGFGLLVQPFAIYFLGQQLLGEYGDEGGAMALAEAIWLDLLALQLPAWILVLWPYIAVQSVRFVWRLWRPRPL
jgi:hypothetical protein